MHKRLNVVWLNNQLLYSFEQIVNVVVSENAFKLQPEMQYRCIQFRHSAKLMQKVVNVSVFDLKIELNLLI